MASFSLGRRRVLPGFAPTLGFTLFYLSLIVLVPLAAVFLKRGQVMEYAHDGPRR